MINRFNEKGVIPNKIDSFTIALDIATKKTGIAICINKKPLLVDEILTPTKNDGMGLKALADIQDLEKWIYTSHLGTIMQDIATLGIKKEIDITNIKMQIILENGIITNKSKYNPKGGGNIKTLQLLSIWTGLYIGSFIHILKMLGTPLFRNVEFKIITPMEWIRHLPKINKSQKNTSIYAANKALQKIFPQSHYQVANDNESDALLMALWFAKCRDTIQARQTVTKARRDRLRHLARTNKIRSLLSKRVTLLNAKKQKSIDKCLNAKKQSKCDPKKLLYTPYWEFATKVEREQFNRWSAEVEKLEKIYE